MDYQKQAQDFMDKVGATMEVKFLKHDKYFSDDKESRDIYEVTLKRGSRSFTFNFGQSINASGKWIASIYVQNTMKLSTSRLTDEMYEKIKKRSHNCGDLVKNTAYEIPTAYSVLACLQKSDPGTFEWFCREFGYDSKPLMDYPKVRQIYESVLNEYQNVKMLFSDEEIEMLCEIQ